MNLFRRANAWYDGVNPKARVFYWLLIWLPGLATHQHPCCRCKGSDEQCTTRGGCKFPSYCLLSGVFLDPGNTYTLLWHHNGYVSSCIILHMSGGWLASCCCTHNVTVGLQHSFLASGHLTGCFLLSVNYPTDVASGIYRNLMPPKGWFLQWNVSLQFCNVFSLLSYAACYLIICLWAAYFSVCDSMIFVSF